MTTTWFDFFFFLKNTTYFNIHTHGEREEGLKKINSSVYPKYIYIYTQYLSFFVTYLGKLMSHLIKR